MNLSWTKSVHHGWVADGENHTYEAKLERVLCLGDRGPDWYENKWKITQVTKSGEIVHKAHEDKLEDAFNCAQSLENKTQSGRKR